MQYRKKASEFDASSNESGLPLLRFTDGNFLFGSHLLGKERSWVFNEATKTLKHYDIGSIISDKFIQDWQ
jgi:hypothetical protein